MWQRDVWYGKRHKRVDEKEAETKGGGAQKVLDDGWKDRCLICVI